MNQILKMIDYLDEFSIVEYNYYSYDNWTKTREWYLSYNVNNTLSLQLYSN
jgi:hypothetical protein